jgi:hypothetical protein
MRNSQIIGICLVVSAVILAAAILFQGRAGRYQLHGVLPINALAVVDTTSGDIKMVQMATRPEAPQGMPPGAGGMGLPPGASRTPPGPGGMPPGASGLPPGGSSLPPGTAPNLGSGVKGPEKAATAPGEAKKEPPKTSK